MTTAKREKKHEKTDRGPYRSCYLAMADDADIHAMSGDAFKLFWMLKLTLPTAGIGVIYESVLVDRLGVSRERLGELFAELAAAKPGSDRGWIMRDRNIVWLVNALKFEPGMKSYSPNHRKNVHGSVNQLLARSPVVAAFKEYYAEWFAEPSGSDEEDDTEGSEKGSAKGLAGGLGKGSEGVSDSEAVAVAAQNQQQHKGEAVDLDHPAAGGADDGPSAGSTSATASPPALQEERRNGVTSLPANARRVLRDCYGIRGKVAAAALTPRQKQVYQDILSTLGERGALLERGQYVRAVDAAHLDDVCGKILNAGVDKPDAALRLVLLELRKTWQEVKASREKAALGDREQRETRAAPMSRQPTPITSLVFAPKPTGSDDAQRWLEALPFIRRSEVEGEVDRLVKAAGASNHAPSVREKIRVEALVTIWNRERTKAGVA